MAAAGNFYLFDIGGLCSIFFTPFHRKWWWLDSWLSSPDLLLTPQIARITLRGLTHEISGKICCLCVAEKCEKFWSAFLNSFLVRMRKTLSQKNVMRWNAQKRFIDIIIFSLCVESLRIFSFRSLISCGKIQKRHRHCETRFPLSPRTNLYSPRGAWQSAAAIENDYRALQSRRSSSSLMASHTGTFRIPLWLQFPKTSRDSPSAPCEEFKIEISLSCYFICGKHSTSTSVESD